MPHYDFPDNEAPQPAPEPVLLELPVEPKPAPPPPRPSKISKEDRLELEVFQVKLQNVQLQLQIMQADLAKALAERNNLVEGMKKKREEIQAKYGVDIAQVKIADDGTITPIVQQSSVPGPLQNIIKPLGTP